MFARNRDPFRVCLQVAIVLSQIGEFSFILATMGTDLNILPPSAQNVLVAAAIISITLNPILYRAIRNGECWLARTCPGLIQSFDQRCSVGTTEASPPEPEPETPRAVVIGYGPVGRTVVRLLRENEIDLTIVELNIETVKMLHARGLRAIYGDATRTDTLSGAGVKNADVLVISVSHTGGNSEIVRQAKIINPRIRIIVRTEFLAEISTLHDAGADAVFTDEGEVALSVTEYILRINGATPDQIDRERDRVHSDLFFKKNGRMPDED